MAEGLLVAVEGLDGSGKSTLVRRLDVWLGPLRHRTLAFYDVPVLAEQFRALNTRGLIGSWESSLMYAAEAGGRAATVAAETLAAGGVVVWDKYAAGGHARDAARGVPDVLLAAAYDALPRPDLVLYVDVEPRVALARKHRLTLWECGLDLFYPETVPELERALAEGRFDRFELERRFLEFSARVRDQYERLLGDHVRLDGELPEDELFLEASAVLEPFLHARAPPRFAPVRARNG
jgi:thymidylate kinase